MFHKNNSSEKGSLVLLVPLSLLLISGLMVSLQSSFFLKTSSDSFFDCENLIKKNMKPLLYNINKLIKLNPLAKKLRLQKKVLLSTLPLALLTQNFPLVQSIKAQLKILKKKQFALQTQQKSLLFLIKTLEKTISLKINSKFRSSLRSDIKTFPPQFKFSKTPSTSLTPNYSLTWIKSKIRTQWKTFLFDVKATYQLPELNKNKNLSLSQFCAFTVYKEKIWKIRASKAAYL